MLKILVLFVVAFIAILFATRKIKLLLFSLIGIIITMLFGVF